MTGPLDPETWPASRCVDQPSAFPVALRVFFPDSFENGPPDATVKQGAKFSLHVAIENQSGKRIGCLGETGLSLSYRVRRQSDFEIVSERKHLTALTHDLIAGVTFHYVNIVVDWDAVQGELFDLEIDLLSPETGWLYRHATATLTVESATMRSRPRRGRSRSRHRFQEAEASRFHDSD